MTTELNRAMKREALLAQDHEALSALVESEGEVDALEMLADSYDDTSDESESNGVSLPESDAVAA